jgi:hypothetical protein
MKRILWSLALVLTTAGVCSAQSVLNFAEFLDGTLDRNSVVWWTVIIITNPAALGTPVASGSITLTNDDGTPMNITFLDLNGGPAGNTFQLAGGQTKLFISPSTSSPIPLPLKVGAATATSNLAVVGGTTIVEAGPYLNSSAAGFAINQAAVLSSPPLTRQETLVVELPQFGTRTALAAVNPGTGTATITFQLLDSSATQLVPPVTRTLAANHHTAFFVDELFPNAPAAILGGTLRITSDTAIASTALFFQGSLFSTLPVIPLP